MRKRQAFSLKGIKRRLGDANLARVRDKRRKDMVKYETETVVKATLAGMISGLLSTRGCEALTANMASDVRKALSIPGRIADNTLANAVARLDVDSVDRALVRMVKAEHRRGNLKPDELGIGAVAIDGKNVATLHYKDLLRLCKVEDGPDAADRIAAVLKANYPYVQLHRPDDGEVYAVIRQHNVALISSKAVVTALTRPIEANTNEIGALPALLDRLHRAYAHTKLFDLVTADAGNTSAQTATQMRRYGWHYLLRIKANQPEMLAEAQRLLADLGQDSAQVTFGDKQNGKAVCYKVWTYDLDTDGYLNYGHARQFIRVYRYTVDVVTGTHTEGNRYYIASMPSSLLGPKQALKVCRAYWRVENNIHWTADAVLGEDHRRLALSRHPNGILVVAALRAIAGSILAVLRALSRIGYSRTRPSWKMVITFVQTQLGILRLDTEAFDAV